MCIMCLWNDDTGNKESLFLYVESVAVKHLDPHTSEALPF